MPNIWKVAVLSVFTVTLLIGANAAYASDSSTDIFTVENESMTIFFVNESSADATHVRTFLDNETITNSSGTTLVEGTDYEWNTSTGNVTWFNTERTSSGESAEIDYAYRGPTDGTILSAAILRIFGSLLGILLFVAGISVMWDLTGGGI